MGTSNPAQLRAAQLARDIAAIADLVTETRDIAAEGRDASVLVARELMPPVETPAPDPVPEEATP